MQAKIVSWEILSPATLEKDRDIVQWIATASKTMNNVFQIRLVAKLAPGHMLYSQKTETFDGICPTKLHFNRPTGLVQLGLCNEMGGGMEPVEESWVIHPDRTGRIRYIQQMLLLDDQIQEISGTVRYQVLSDHEVMDAQTTVFSIPLKH